MAASTTGSVVSTKLPVVTMTQWARINAKAWVEASPPPLGTSNTTFKNLLETDPLAALDLVRKDFGIRDEARHFNIDDPTYGGGTDESGSEPKFDTLIPARARESNK